MPVPTRPALSMRMELWLLVSLFTLAVVVGGFNAAVGPTGGAMIGGVTLLVPPPLSVTLHALTSAYSSALRATTLRHFIDWRLAARLIAWSLPALALASSLAVTVDPRAWTAVIGGFLVAWGLSERLRRVVASVRRVGPVAALASVAAVWVGTGSMAVMPFILGRTRSKEAAIATEAAYVAVQHLVKLVFLVPALAWSLQELAWPVIALLAGSTVGNLAGSRLLVAISETTHRRLLRGVLATTGLVLIISTVVGW